MNGGVLLRVDLHWPTGPPLSLNRDLHWAAKARIKKQMHVDLQWRLHRRPPITGPVVIELLWVVVDNRVRDVDNPTPTLKVCVDAMVRAGVLVQGDSHRFVTRSYCRIEHGQRPRMFLTVFRASPDERPTA